MSYTPGKATFVRHVPTDTGNASLYRMTYGPRCFVNESARIPWVLAKNDTMTISDRHSPTGESHRPGVGLFESDEHGTVGKLFSHHSYPDVTHDRAMRGHAYAIEGGEQ